MTFNKEQNLHEKPRQKNQQTNQQNAYSPFILPRCEIFGKDSVLKCEALTALNSYTKKKNTDPSFEYNSITLNIFCLIYNSVIKYTKFFMKHVDLKL